MHQSFIKYKYEKKQFNSSNYRNQNCVFFCFMTLCTFGINSSFSQSIPSSLRIAKFENVDTEPEKSALEPKKELPTPEKPSPICELVVSNIPDPGFDCSPPTQDPPCSCSDCDFFSFQYQGCPNQGEVDWIRIHSSNGGCFYACAYLVAPTSGAHQIWTSSRSTCDANDLTIQMGTWQNPFTGGCACTLYIKICGDDGAHYDYYIHTYGDPSNQTTHGTVQDL